MHLVRSAVLMAGLLSCGAAVAHTGQGTQASLSGFIAGLNHPAGGLDHLLAMVSVGILAAMLGGRAIWAVPLAFLTMMAAGGGLALVGVALPAVETMIILSVIVLGLAAASGRQVPIGVLVTLAGGFALFHGHAHGAEIGAGQAAIAYVAGFVLATAALHGVGIGFARMTVRQPAIARLAGGAVALAGIMLAGF